MIFLETGGNSLPKTPPNIQQFLDDLPGIMREVVISAIKEKNMHIVHEDTAG